jgi:hypothetical protein
MKFGNIHVNLIYLERGRVSPRSRACALPRTSPLPHFPCSSSRTFFFLFFANGPRRWRGMYSSASGSQNSWPRYGEVPMTRCPYYPRLDSLKRLTCVHSTRGNVGREFVKCESKPRLGKDGKVGFVLICLDLVWFQFCIFDLGIRVCVPLFRIWRNAASLNEWISTFGVEGFKFKCYPQSRLQSRLLWRRRSQTWACHWRISRWIGACRNWTSSWARLWNWRSSKLAGRSILGVYHCPLFFVSMSFGLFEISI